MDCTGNGPSSRAFLTALDARARAQRIPLSGGIDLTSRCNLNCVHCYMARAQREAPRDLLAADRLHTLLDEIRDAGCLFLLLTGGEPLLRYDFADIYRHAQDNGFLLTLFSNATLVDERVCALLAEMPPRHVEVTLYGAEATTHERVTGVPGSFAAALRGVRMLSEAGVRLTLKTIVMTLNQDSVAGVRLLAERIGAKFRFDAEIFPRLDGDRSPLALRIPPPEAAALEFADKELARAWEAHYEKYREGGGLDCLYPCSAGLTTFHVDAAGRLKPCLMVAEPFFDLKTGAFADGWAGPVRGVREQRPAEALSCRQCERRSLCGYCPGFFRLETGSEQCPSPFLCKMAEARTIQLAKCTPEGGYHGTPQAEREEQAAV